MGRYGILPQGVLSERVKLKRWSFYFELDSEWVKPAVVGNSPAFAVRQSLPLHAAGRLGNG